MQLQTNTETKTAKQEFKLGDTVKWQSHANGNTRTKKGTIIAVMKPGISYQYFKNLPKNYVVQVLREYGYTRDEARNIYDSLGYYDRFVQYFRSVYKLKFSPAEGMRRNTYHYLIEVDPPKGRGTDIRLYHPKTSLLSKA